MAAGPSTSALSPWGFPPPASGAASKDSSDNKTRFFRDVLACASSSKEPMIAFFFNSHVLHALGSLFGRPLQSDHATASRSRSSVARILMELEITKKYPKDIWLGSETSSYLHKVEYENVPDFCTRCTKHMFGPIHGEPSVSEDRIIDNEKDQTMTLDEPEIIVNLCIKEQKRQKINPNITYLVSVRSRQISANPARDLVLSKNPGYPVTARLDCASGFVDKRELDNSLSCFFRIRYLLSTPLPPHKPTPDLPLLSLRFSKPDSSATSDACNQLRPPPPISTPGRLQAPTPKPTPYLAAALQSPKSQPPPLL
ncbi:hypothetical protein M5K25_004719 [Dendrobium thyrsiflorum]|uniref:Uncharacterized protein n=1 Tax=Dendrobium thyrsiflorum TaxID=117978 RepID=A0ABD0VGV4_DENTH